MDDTVIIDERAARLEGEKRHAAHASSGTQRFYRDAAHEDTLGVTAELAFAKWAGLKADLEVKPHGDGGKDFEVNVGGRTITIDVKASRAPINLFLKERDVHHAADIFVLAKVEGDEVTFIGWEHLSMMLLSPKKDFGRGIVNHYRHHSMLRPMWQLMPILKPAK